MLWVLQLSRKDFFMLPFFFFWKKNKNRFLKVLPEKKNIAAKEFLETASAWLEKYETDAFIWNDNYFDWGERMIISRNVGQLSFFKSEG